MTRLKDKLIEDVYRQYELGKTKKRKLSPVILIIEFLFLIKYLYRTFGFKINYDSVIEKLC